MPIDPEKIRRLSALDNEGRLFDGNPFSYDQRNQLLRFLGEPLCVINERNRGLRIVQVLNAALRGERPTVDNDMTDIVNSL